MSTPFPPSLSPSLPLPFCPLPKWVKVQPTGLVHFKTKSNDYHYSWNKPHTTVHNLIFGQLWADHEGDVVVTSHQTGDKAVVTWSSYSKVKDRYRELIGKYSTCACTCTCIHVNYWGCQLDAQACLAKCMLHRNK